MSSSPTPTSIRGAGCRRTSTHGRRTCSGSAGWRDRPCGGLQNHVGRYLGYLLDPAYDWANVCEHYFGTHPVQVCSEWNTVTHGLEDERRPGNRPMTREELDSFFSYCDDQVGRAVTNRRKGALSAARDAAAFKTQYAFGLRRREVVKLEVVDVHENPRTSEFGRAGLVGVRWGRGHAGTGPKRSPVLTVIACSV